MHKHESLKIWRGDRIWVFFLCVFLLYYLFEFAYGLCLVINDFGFDFEGIIVPLILFLLRLQLSAQHLNPGLQASTVLS